MPTTEHQSTNDTGTNESMNSSIYPKRITTIDAQWRLIQKGLDRIFAHDDETKDLEPISAIQLYTRVYEVCCCYPISLLDPLYSQIVKFLVDKVSEIRQSLLMALSNEAINKSSYGILNNYTISWSHYYHSVQHMNTIFDYMNRLVIMERNNSKNRPGYEDIIKTSQEPQSNKMPVSMLAFTLWEKCLLMYVKEQAHNRIISDILSSIHSDRQEYCKRYNVNSQIISNHCLNDAVRESIKSFVVTCHEKSNQLSLYEQEFESLLLEQTRQFYTMQSHILLTTHSVNDYLIIVEELILDEEKRAKRYYHNSSHGKIMKVVEEQLIIAHIQVIQKEFMKLLIENRVNDLTRFYQLLSRVNQGIRPLLSVFEEYIIDLCIQKCSIDDFKSGNERLIMDKLLEIHEETSSLISKCFQKNSDLEASLDKGFRIVVNRQRNDSNGIQFKAPEAISLYFDHVLDNRTISCDDQKRYSKLRQLIVLFKFIEDKDVFQRCYAQCLAKRLLSDSCASDDHEAWVLDQFKLICGYEYTSKLHRMFIDVESSKEQNKAFERYRKDHQFINSIDMQISVLTSGSWPLNLNDHNSHEYAIHDLNNLQNHFQQHYQTCHSGRKLTWIKELSRYCIILKGFDKPYELWISYYQMELIMICSKAIKIKNALDTFECSWIELSKYLIPLMEIGLIQCYQKSDTMILQLSVQDISKSSFGSDWYINMNYSFQSSTTRLELDSRIEVYQYTGISSVIDGVTTIHNDVDEQGFNNKKDLDENRKLYLQALIVRLMKEKKELHQQELVQLIYSQSNPLFVPSMVLIKKCLDGLVEKGYLDREVSNDSTEKYCYLA